MKHVLALSVLSLGLVSAEMSHACCVTNGQIVARDKERQLVQLDDGSVYFVPNRNWLFDLRPRRFATLWYRERDGVREVWRQDVKPRFVRFN